MEQHSVLIMCFSFFMLFLAISAQGEIKSFLVPNYDNIEHKLKVFDIKSSLVLSCNISKDGDYDLKWAKNGSDVAKVESLQGRYKLLKPERKFIIEKTDQNDAGQYTCAVNEKDLQEKKDFNVVANVAVRVPSNTGVVEGEKLRIQCAVLGTDPELSWEYAGNVTLTNSTGKYLLREDENKIQNAIIEIENTSLEDKGEYKCIARNDGTKYAGKSPAMDVSYVRVKGKLAALWPFLGICAEVFILCAIILMYERRRNKAELEESDTDPNTEQEKLKPQRN